MANVSQNIHDRPAGRQRGTAAARAGGRIGRLRVLILGGYGTFGGRLAELLAGDIRLALLIAGRSEEKAVAFAAEELSRCRHPEVAARKRRPRRMSGRTDQRHPSRLATLAPQDDALGLRARNDART